MTMIQRIRWHVVNGNVQWIWPDEDVLDAIYATLEHCEALIAAEKPITKEQAMAMVSNAEGHIWARIPPKHFISEYPPNMRLSWTCRTPIGCLGVRFGWSAVSLAECRLRVRLLG